MGHRFLPTNPKLTLKFVNKPKADSSVSGGKPTADSSVPAKKPKADSSVPAKKTQS